MDFNEDELSAEELAEIEAEQKESEARFELGQRCDLDGASHSELLLTGSAVMVQSEDEKVCVDRDSLPRGAVIKQQFFVVVLATYFPSFSSIGDRITLI